MRAMKKRIVVSARRWLGTGSSRIVYALRGKRVVKVARNLAGIAQNRAEVEFAQSDRFNPNVYTRIYSYAVDYTWVIAEIVHQPDTRTAPLTLSAEERVRNNFGVALDGTPKVCDYGFNDDVAERFYRGFKYEDFEHIITPLVDIRP